MWTSTIIGERSADASLILAPRFIGIEHAASVDATLYDHDRRDKAANTRAARMIGVSVSLVNR